MTQQYYTSPYPPSRRTSGWRLAGQIAWPAIVLSYPLSAFFGENAQYLEYVSLAAIVGSASWLFLTAAKRLIVPYALVLAALGVFTLAAFLGEVVLDPTKAEKFALTIALFGIVLSVSFIHPSFRQRVPLALLTLGSIALGLFLLGSNQHGFQRLTFGEANPIWFARVLGYSLVAGGMLIAAGSRHRFKIALVVLVISGGAIVLTGSRGPLLSGIAALLTGLFLTDRDRIQNFVLIFCSVALVGFALVSFDLIPNVRGLTFDTTSTVQRQEMQVYVLTLIPSTPEGVGVGGFFYGPHIYPHNILLEFLVEWGWMLGGLASVAIVWAGVRLIYLPKSFDVLKILYVYELINALVSGDVTSPRILYAIVIVALMPKNVVLGGRKQGVLRHTPRLRGISSFDVASSR